MKKVVFALIGAVAMTLIPTGVNATTQTDYDNGECKIIINSGETATAATTNCRIENHGTLNISGATINKMTMFNGAAGENLGDAAIINYGTINMYGGKIYANYGYGINNRRGGSVYVHGGTIHSILHQAIWGEAGSTTNIIGGTIKGAIGGEEAVKSYGALNITGGTINGTPVAKAEEPAKEEIVIAVTTSEKNTAKSSTPAQTTSAAKSTTTQTATPIATENTTETSSTETTEKTDKKVEAKKESNDKKTDDAEKANEEEAENNNLFVFALAAIITVFGTATAAVVTSRIRH